MKSMLAGILVVLLAIAGSTFYVNRTSWRDASAREARLTAGLTAVQNTAQAARTAATEANTHATGAETNAAAAAMNAQAAITAAREAEAEARRATDMAHATTEYMVPELDGDDDNIINAEDLCRTEAAGDHPDPTRRGCPDPDTDRDGYRDHGTGEDRDECPQIPIDDDADTETPAGDTVHQGCPVGVAPTLGTASTVNADGGTAEADAASQPAPEPPAAPVASADTTNIGDLATELLAQGLNPTAVNRLCIVNTATIAALNTAGASSCLESEPYCLRLRTEGQPLENCPADGSRTWGCIRTNGTANLCQVPDGESSPVIFRCGTGTTPCTAANIADTMRARRRH